MPASSKVSPQEVSFWPRIDDPERSGPQRGLRTAPELCHAGPVWPVPQGLCCASDGVLADRPLLIRQLSVSREKNSPKHPPLSAPCRKEKYSPKTKHLSLLGLWMFKCLYFSGTREVMDRLPPFVISGSVSNSPSLSLKCQKSSASFPPGPLSSCLIERLWDEDGDQRGNLSPTSFWLTGLSSEAQPIGLALIMTWDDGMLIRTDQALNSLSDAPGSLRGHR